MDPTQSEESRLDLNSRNSTSTERAFPTTLSDVVFRSSLDPDSDGNIYKVLGSLRKSTLSIPNRLLSVLQDADFVNALLEHLTQHCSSSLNQSSTQVKDTTRPEVYDDQVGSPTWPAIPNERSGSWPLSSQVKISSQQAYLSSFLDQSRPPPVSAYFKSTDGHVNQWAFSTRRLNLPVLNLLGAAGCAVLVDATRRGKAYPDALRRTVPIFTSVWNHFLFGDLTESGVCDFQGFGLEDGEISQIEKRIPGFVRDLKGLELSEGEMRQKVKRPVRCLWVSQPSRSEAWETTFDTLVGEVEAEQEKWKSIGGVSILICCSASRKVIGAEMSEDGYIQGAGDDSEGWSQGLTAKLFWDNCEALMDLVKSGGDVDDLVQGIVNEDKAKRGGADAVPVKPTSNLFLSAGKASTGNFDMTIDCNAASPLDTATNLNLGCKEGKLGSKMLREQLPKAKEKVSELLAKQQHAKILITCSTGKDLSVGVILMILCSFYNDKGSVDLDHGRYVDKQFIKQRLAWITTSKPDANPSRATLQAVNSFLMDRPG